MGKALFYCFKCSRVIREEELETGRAFRIGDRVACEDCAKSLPGGAPARPAATPPAFRPRSSSQRVPVPPATPRSAFPPSPPARPSILPYLLVGGIALLLIIVVAVASSGRSRGGGAPPPPPRPSEPAPR